MGKGTIVSHIANGEYSLQINYDKTKFDAAIATLDKNIEALETQIYTELQAGTDAYNLAKLQLTALEKQKQFLVSGFPDDKTINAWCADLTEDLAGIVATIEVPGESNSIQIAPGYTDNAAYSEASGQLSPTIAQGAPQAFYNLAMLPGWQKWKPTFRYGTITSKDGDTANVTIDDIRSSQQSLSINQTPTLTDVPIEYMSCNGDAFEVGDAILIMFTGQDWTKPKIIGFKDNPQKCPSGIVIKPKFNNNFAVYGCQKIMYRYTFEGVEKIGWVQIYGSDYNKESQTIQSCSSLIDFDTQNEFYSFESTAKFYVASTKPLVPETAEGATFCHFHIVDNPDAPNEPVYTNWVPEVYHTHQIGLGDGTTSPILSSVSLPIEGYGFSTSPDRRIEISAYDVNGRSVVAYLDVYGFPHDSYNSDLISGHLNVLTGEWDIPPVWDVAIRQDEPIILKYYARNYADTMATVIGDTYELLRRVDFIEADNNMLSADREFVDIDGEQVTAYNIEFSGLKLMLREPNDTAETNLAYSRVGSGYGCIGLTAMCQPQFASDCYGIYGYTPGQENAYKLPAGAYDTYMFLSYIRYISGIQLLPTDNTFWGVLSDADGRDPFRPSYTYSVKIWLHEVMAAFSEEDMLYCANGTGNNVTTCEGQGSLSQAWLAENGCPCVSDIWTWDYSMVDTPSDAF